MTDLGLPNWNNVIHLNQQDRPAVEREPSPNSSKGRSETGNAPKQRRRRRWGGRLFAFGGFLLLAGGLSLGARGSYSQQRQVMATAEQERDFVPSLRVETVAASPDTM
jgi:hypothetical protein